MRNAPIGASNKRGYIHPVNHANVLLADFHTIHQSTNYLPTSLPVRFLQPCSYPVGELLHVADHSGAPAGLGELGDDSGPSGRQARVSYVGYYYDSDNHLTDSVDFGVRTGLFTRPSAPTASTPPNW